MVRWLRELAVTLLMLGAGLLLALGLAIEGGEER